MIFNPLFIDSDSKQLNLLGVNKNAGNSHLFKDIIKFEGELLNERQFNSGNILPTLLSEVNKMKALTEYDNKIQQLNNKLLSKNLLGIQSLPTDVPDLSVTAQTIDEKDIHRLLQKIFSELELDHQLQQPSDIKAKETAKDILSNINIEKLVTEIEEKLAKQGDVNCLISSIDESTNILLSIHKSDVNDNVNEEDGLAIESDSGNKVKYLIKVFELGAEESTKVKNDVSTSELNKNMLHEQTIQGNGKSNKTSDGEELTNSNNTKEAKIDKGGKTNPALSGGNINKENSKSSDTVTPASEVSDEKSSKVAGNSANDSSDKILNQKSPDTRVSNTTKINIAETGKNETEIKSADNNTSKNDTPETTGNDVKNQGAKITKEDVKINSSLGEKSIPKTSESKQGNAISKDQSSSNSEPGKVNHSNTKTSNNTFAQDILTSNKSENKSGTSLRNNVKIDTGNINATEKPVENKKVNLPEKVDVDFVVKLSPKDTPKDLLTFLGSRSVLNTQPKAKMNKNIESSNQVHELDPGIDEKSSLDILSKTKINADELKSSVDTKGNQIHLHTKEKENIKVNQERINVTEEFSKQSNKINTNEETAKRNVDTVGQVKEVDKKEIHTTESKSESVNSKEVESKNTDTKPNAGGSSQENSSNQNKQQTDAQNKPQQNFKIEEPVHNFTQNNINQQQVEAKVVKVNLQNMSDPNLANKLSDEISEMVISKGQDKAVLSLEPKHLGKIKIAIEIVDNQLSAKVEVENSGVKEMLQNQVDVLKENLNNSGIQLSSLNISLQQNTESKNNKNTVKNKRKDDELKEVKAEGKDQENGSNKSMGYNTYEFIV